MRSQFSTAILAAVLLCLMSLGVEAQVKDVSGTHWAWPAVQHIVARGIMNAPGGKFNGAAKITRRELAKALAEFARNLEKGWVASAAKPVAPAYRDMPVPPSGAVSRFELAAFLFRAAAYGSRGVPKQRSNVFGDSEALPPAPKVTLAASDPAYASVKYLASRRMIDSRSILMKPGSQPVLPAELARAVAGVLVGLNDQYTDEPQNREPITPPRRAPQ